MRVTVPPSDKREPAGKTTRLTVSSSTKGSCKVTFSWIVVDPASSRTRSGLSTMALGAAATSFFSLISTGWIVSSSSPTRTARGDSTRIVPGNLFFGVMVIVAVPDTEFRGIVSVASVTV